MKKAVGTLVLALAILVLDACGTGKSNEELIIGTWNTTQFLVDGEESDRKDVLQGFIFREDGTVAALGEDTQEQSMGTFELKGDTLIMSEGNTKAYLRELGAKEMVMVPIDDRGPEMEIHLKKE
jgi:hypothetical protein